MRIWSIHPKHLDAKGLIALWRETLLAKHVLQGKTKGYKNHPQLNRFKTASHPLECINQYLETVQETATQRGYNFDKKKINPKFKKRKLRVTIGQIEYETKHLLNKLKKRDEQKYAEVSVLKKLQPHPLFSIRKGKIESWEIIT